ncbi:MAG: molybdopterin molybdotransferase MoeA [Alphaproteobacteria bacterium]|nr:molybdopterin molybdotransferase MoeA [Alphaproteobacteria bacterium]
MLSVKEARDRILATITPTPAEQIGMANGLGRVLAEDIASRRTQPPTDVSAMDGYAVRAADVANVPATLEVVGHAPAGGEHEGALRSGEAVRIFTGGPVPNGADAIVIQEDTDTDGDTVTVRESSPVGHYVRPAGLDFSEGDVILHSGDVMTARNVGMVAAMNVPWISVRRKPRIAILATGDEIVMPGDPLGPNQIVSSNSLALAAMIEAVGCEPILLGIAPDDRGALSAMAATARGADMLVTTGGASVGDHDLIQSVLGDHGLEVDFWKIAMRPGKPLIFGDIKGTPLLGLPGNPVSTLVCGIIFLIPALQKMLGQNLQTETTEFAVLGVDLGSNDQREDYLRARLSIDDSGDRIATPFSKQDSSMLSRLVRADCLIIRPPHADAINAGERVKILPMPHGLARI